MGEESGSESDENNLSLELKQLVDDLHEPIPFVFWCDFLVSSMSLYGCIILLVAGQFSWFTSAIILVAGTLFMYRCGAFLHEIVHLKPSQLRGFRLAYNLVFGFPFLLPLFLYTPHLHHHAAKKFSTKKDPEYAGWGRNALREFLFYIFISMLVFPASLLMRFTLVPLLSLVLGREFRKWIVKRHSTLSTSAGYERIVSGEKELRAIAFQEFCTTIVCLMILALIITQVIPWTVLLVWYLMAGIGSALNLSRGSVNHGYQSRDNATGLNRMVMDSVNITTDSVWSWFWSPLDTKYHRLHHLFPGIPYHSLQLAHERLVSYLPPDHLYFKATKQSYREAFSDLILGK